MSLIHFNWFDYCLVGIVFLSLIFGLLRGFLREIISLITWIAAFFVAIMFTSELVVYFNQYIKTEFLSSLASFLSLFIVTLIIGALINYIVTSIVRKTGLSIPDRFLGAVFGFIRGFLIALLVIFLLTNTQWQEKKWFQKSQLTCQFQSISSWMQEKVIAVAKKAHNKN